MDTVLDIFRLRSTYGIQVQSEILGRKRNELQSVIAKIALSQGRFQAEPQVVAAEFGEIFESDFENLGVSQASVFYQGSTENVKFYFQHIFLNTDFRKFVLKMFVLKRTDFLTQTGFML